MKKLAKELATPLLVFGALVLVFPVVYVIGFCGVVKTAVIDDSKQC